LVVHGPLIATLLMDLVRRNAPEADVATFRFKAVRPTFDLNPFRVNGDVTDSAQAPASPAPEGRSPAVRAGGGQDGGKTVKLWAQDHEGWLTMDAVATLR
jgi:3-methylfumaryl-CoA hydratase